MADTQPIMIEGSSDTTVEYKPLLIRFYILLIVALYNFLSMFYFNSWQPIMESLETVFNWSLTSINLLPNVYALTYVVLIIPFMYLWNKIGLRQMLIISVFFMVFGASIRVYYTSVHNTQILIHISNAFISISSIMALVIPPVISAIWFPYYERNLATAFTLAMRELGNAVSPLLIPFVLPDMELTKEREVHNAAITSDTLTHLNSFFYIEFIVTILIFFLIILYFPNRPDQLPSKSSDELLRISFEDGIKNLTKMRNFWIIFFMNFILYGVQTGMGLVYTSTFTSFGLTQRQIGVSNFVNIMCIVVGVMLGGFLGEKFQYKRLVNVLIGPQVLLFILYGLQIMKLIPYDLVSIYILQMTREFACAVLDPLLYEMACEAAFPVNEVIVSSMLGISSNLGTSIFLSISMIPNIGVIWIPFSYAILVSSVWIMNLFYDDTRNRQNVDTELVKSN